MSIASEITRLQGAKSDLKDAIEGKGVTVSSATKLDGYADLVDAISQGGGTLGTKIITANGQYDASDDGYDGYSEIDVNVPNTYSASDEGKVVSNGALVAQTSDTVTANDTYDTTLINSLTVNVSGGGGITPDGMANRSEPNGSIVLTTNTIAAQAFAGCVNLTDVGVDSVTSLGNYAFSNCKKLGVLHFKALSSALPSNNYIFSEAGKIDQTIVVLPQITSIGSRLFRFAQMLKVDLGVNVSAIGADSFYSNISGVICQTLILRRTQSVVSASSADAINGLRDVYVPQALTSDYTSASNWSTKISAGIITLHAIEGSIYATAYADGTAIS